MSRVSNISDHFKKLRNNIMSLHIENNEVQYDIMILDGIMT